MTRERKSHSSILPPVCAVAVRASIDSRNLEKSALLPPCVDLRHPSSSASTILAGVVMCVTREMHRRYEREVEEVKEPYTPAEVVDGDGMEEAAEGLPLSRTGGGLWAGHRREHRTSFYSRASPEGLDRPWPLPWPLPKG